MSRTLPNKEIEFKTYLFTGGGLVTLSFIAIKKIKKEVQGLLAQLVSNGMLKTRGGGCKKF